MGARLGRYLVLKHLASGGMADVLLGRTEGIEGFERHVVLKRIRPEHARDLRFIRMFLDEARVAANLHHQHIVQVHDVGEVAGEYFIAMEYLHGEDVRTLLSTAARTRQHVPLGHAMAIVSAAAAGLHYAHERRGPDKRPLGIVHRDVSPSNILVGYDGSIKIVDFGIAKASAQQDTGSGDLKGKVSYMSPEQCNGAGVDRRSDVYALGVVLYELATTTRLFKGDNDYLVMDQIVHGRIALPRVRRPDLPNELSSIIMRAIAPDPDRRFGTADELRLALDHFAARTQLTASTSSIAAYMRKQFGEKPEPWLDLGGQAIDALPGEQRSVIASGTSRPGHSWADEVGEDKQVRGSGEIARPSAPSGAIVAARRPAVAAAAASAGPPGAPGTWRTIIRRPTSPPPPPPTESRMGWERQRPARAPRGRRHVKLALIALPVIAALAVAIWWSSGGSASAPAAEVAVRPAAPAPLAVEPRTTPAPAPPRAELSAAALDRGADASPHAPERVARAAEPAPGGSPKRSSVPAARKPSTAKVVESPTSDPAPRAADSALAPPASAGLALPPMPVVAPAPVAPDPVVEATPPLLAHAVIERIASGHKRELSKCDGGAELHGEVTVRFTVGAGGAVTRSQVATSMHKLDVATCILHQVQRWHFDGQPAGAQGAYTVSFQ